MLTGATTANYNPPTTTVTSTDGLGMTFTMPLSGYTTVSAGNSLGFSVPVDRITLNGQQLNAPSGHVIGYGHNKDIITNGGRAILNPSGCWQTNPVLGGPHTDAWLNVLPMLPTKSIEYYYSIKEKTGSSLLKSKRQLVNGKEYTLVVYDGNVPPLVNLSEYVLVESVYLTEEDTKLNIPKDTIITNFYMKLDENKKDAIYFIKYLYNDVPHMSSFKLGELLEHGFELEEIGHYLVIKWNEEK